MELHWWDGPLVGFDTETTGVDVENDRIVTANITWHLPGAAPRKRDVLINPGIDIPQAASDVHGISTQYAQEHGMDASDGVAVILDTLRACLHLPIVAYNGTFDLTLLNREAIRYNLEPVTPRYVIDPFVLDKYLDPYRKGKRTLGAACEVYGVILDNAHNADADSLAALLLARMMGDTRRLPTDLNELYQLQVKAKAAQAANFTAYLRSKGKDDVIAPEWPILPLRVADGAA